MNELLTSTGSQERVEIISVNLPKERGINRLLWYLSIMMILIIVAALIYQWRLPRHQGTPEIEQLSELHRSFAQLEILTALSTPQAQKNFAHEPIITLSGVIEEELAALAALGEEYHPFVEQSNRYIQQLQENLPDESLVHQIPEFERGLSGRITLFGELLSTFATDLGEKRNFSIETIREAEGLVKELYQIQNGLDRLISLNFSAKPEALAELTESLGRLDEGIFNLYEGVPIRGVQSMRGSLEEEALNEIEFVFKDISADLTALILNVPNILQLQGDLSKLSSEKQQLDEVLRALLVERYQADRESVEKVGLSNVILIILLLLCAGLMLLIHYLLSRKITHLSVTMREEREENEYHEAAILKLIDQMEFVAAGDLSMELTVTDDSTGIIADSVNVALEKIRAVIEKVDSARAAIVTELSELEEGVLTLQTERLLMVEHRQSAATSLEALGRKMDEVKGVLLTFLKEQGFHNYRRQFLEERDPLLDQELEEMRGVLDQVSQHSSHAIEHYLQLEKAFERLIVDVERNFTELGAASAHLQRIEELIEELSGAMAIFTMPTDERRYQELTFDLTEVQFETSKERRREEES